MTAAMIAAARFLLRTAAMFVCGWAVACFLVWHVIEPTWGAARLYAAIVLLLAARAWLASDTDETETRS